MRNITFDALKNKEIKLSKKATKNKSYNTSKFNKSSETLKYLDTNPNKPLALQVDPIPALALENINLQPYNEVRVRNRTKSREGGSPSGQKYSITYDMGM